MKLKIYKILTGIVLIILIILTLTITRFIAVQQETSLHHHIPSDVSLVLKLNNSFFAKRFLFDFLYDSSFDKNEKKQFKYIKSKKEFTASGINLNKEIYTFYEDWNTKQIIGFLFHVSNKEQLASFFADNDTIIKSFNNKVGCILIPPSNITSDDRAYFEMYAQDLLLKNKDKIKSRISFSNSSPKSLMHFYFEGKENGVMQNSSVEIFIEGQNIIFKGKSNKNPLLLNDDNITKSFVKKAYKDEYLEIEAGQLPDTLNSYLATLFSNLNIELPDINTQQLFIYGLKIENVSDGVVGLPIIDGIFRFKDTINMVKVSEDILNKNIQADSNKMVIFNKTYYYQQVSPTELYIGVNENPIIKTKNTNQVFLMKGSPNALFNIEGTGLVAQIVQLYPPVQHTKQLFNAIEAFKISATENDSGEIKLDGTIRFEKGKTPSIELLKYMLKF